MPNSRTRCWLDGGFFFVGLFVIALVPYGRCLEVIYAINAGGDSHTDSNGIRYARDPLMGKVGTSSDYGKQLLIGRVNGNDQILYQTERYHHNTFGYDIPIQEDGEYVMILKFSEVYFNSHNMKVIFKKYNLFRNVDFELEFEMQLFCFRFLMLF